MKMLHPERAGHTEPGGPGYAVLIHRDCLPTWLQGTKREQDSQGQQGGMELLQDARLQGGSSRQLPISRYGTFEGTSIIGSTRVKVTGWCSHSCNASRLLSGEFIRDRHAERGEIFLFVNPEVVVEPGREHLSGPGVALTSKQGRGQSTNPPDLSWS